MPTYGVNPEVLVWARSEAGLEPREAAEEICVPLEELLALEGCARRPSLALLRKMASKYGRPLAALGMPAPLAPIESPEDFRTIGGAAPRLSSKTRRAIRRALDHQVSAGFLIDEVSDLRVRLTIPTLSLSAGSASAAIRERERLEISVQEQLTWQTSFHSFRAWRAAVEERKLVPHPAWCGSRDEEQ